MDYESPLCDIGNHTFCTDSRCTCGCHEDDK